ncbi:MAG: sterol transfer family, partial [Pseudomonadota bacterium]
GKKYGFDWRQDDLVVVPLQGDLKGVGAADCSIRLSEDSLLRVASGDLNPQVGMLSDKIKVQGKVSFAVYFFNLVAPRGNA